MLSTNVSFSVPPIENLDSTHSPVATPALINAITRCDFVGNLHKLGTGLTPFW